MLSLKHAFPFVLAMALLVVGSNYLVQFPLQGTIGGINLADLFTWGAFTYPIAFLVTDLTNRRFGPAMARRVVVVGFVFAVALSILLASPRIAIASGSAFLIAQFLDISIFDRLRHGAWWRAPLVSSVIGSVIDTIVFFSLAFAPAFGFLGANDAFAIEAAPLFGVLAIEVPRWTSWALSDLGVKLVVGVAMLLPYGALLAFVRPAPALQGR